ncbi:MAG: hypothetical protein ABIJ92_04585 [Candidatus Aenigmatarchaeota archaeon]
MLNYGDALEKGFKFGFSPRRWLPFFILHLVFFLVAFGLAATNLESILSVITEAAINPLALFSLGGFIVSLVFLFAVWTLLNLYLTIALIHQSDKEKEVSKSWSVGYSKFLPGLGLVILISIISMIFSTIAGAIPFAGPVLSTIVSVIISILFFFSLQSLVIKKNGILNSLKDSYHIVTKSPLRVILIWIIITLLVLVILFIFSLPLLGAIALALGPAAMMGGSEAELFKALQSGSVSIIIGAIIMLLGISITQTFTIKTQTEFYKQFKKKKFGLF